MFNKSEEKFIATATDPILRDKQIARLNQSRILHIGTVIVLAVIVFIELLKGTAPNIGITILFIVTLVSGLNLNTEIRFLKILKRLNLPST